MNVKRKMLPCFSVNPNIATDSDSLRDFSKMLRKRYSMIRLFLNGDFKKITFSMHNSLSSGHCRNCILKEVEERVFIGSQTPICAHFESDDP